MDYTVVVVVEDNNAPASSTSRLMRRQHCRILHGKGRDVLIVYDDLTHHARAYRELSLLLRRPPGREAFPATSSIFIRGCWNARPISARNGEADLSRPCPSSKLKRRTYPLTSYDLISITDGRSTFSHFVQLGILPAVDVGKSVSRVGGRRRGRHIEPSQAASNCYSQFEELEAFAKFGTRLDDSTQKTIDTGSVFAPVSNNPSLTPFPWSNRSLCFWL